jgi:hypothetical protein
MGLECTLWQVSPEKLKQYISSEDSVEDFIDFCFPETYEEEVFNDKSKTKKYYENDFCLGKMWHLLHYLLTGDENSKKYPLAYAIVVGYSINEIWSDLTYVEPQEARDIADALNYISEGEFRRRCIEEAFSGKEIYGCPDDLDDNEIAETLKYFVRLKEFFVDAANKGNAVLHLIS